MKKQTFIPIDLNKLPYVERYPIMNQSTIDTIKEEYGGIYDGLKIWLYSDTFRNRKLDPSVFQGIVRFNEEIGEYEIEAKESDMVWLSESELFKDYSVEDVIYPERTRLAKRKLICGFSIPSNLHGNSRQRSVRSNFCAFKEFSGCARPSSTNQCVIR